MDVDLNYVGAAEREIMLANVPQLEAAIDAVCRRDGFTARRVPEERAGGEWTLRYEM